MSTSIIPNLSETLAQAGSDRPYRRSRCGWFDRRLRAGVLRRLDGLEGGTITVTDRDGTWTLGAGTPVIAVTVHDDRFWFAAAFKGSLGVGDAYTAGWWDCDQLVAMLSLITRNAAKLTALEGGLGKLTTPFFNLIHRLRDNTRAGSKRNIAAHYDLSNDFYQLWLDPTMCYSSALFAEGQGTADLAIAQVAKLDRIAALAGVRSHHHVVEIGTGWGAQAVRLADRTGCRVTTTTISTRQREWALRWADEAGLAERVTVLDRDYRDLTGTYDRLVSVEMIEAVGKPHFDTYFAKLGSLLKPDGLAVIQAITVPDQRYELTSSSVDWIKARIFPGCCIPSLGAIAQHLARTTDLRIVEIHDLTDSYARTLRAWRERAEAASERILALGFDRAFLRMWRFYLAYCEAGFAERATHCVQIVLAKPAWRP